MTKVQPEFDLVPALEDILAGFGNPATICSYGDFWETAQKAEAQLANFSDDALVCVVLRSTVADGAEGRDRVDYRVAIDEAGRIESRLGRLWMGATRLQEYDFLCDFSVYTLLRTVHLHDLSIGRGGRPSKKLGGQGLVSRFFGRLAVMLRANVPQFTISSVAIEQTLAGIAQVQQEFGGKLPDGPLALVAGKQMLAGLGQGVIPHLLQKHFGAHAVDSQELQRVCSYVNVDAIDMHAVMVGTV